MKLTLLVVCLCCSCLYASDNPSWHEGSIVLNDGQVKRGMLSLHSHELVLFRANDETMVYPFHKVSALYYYDKAVNLNRKFISIEFQPNVQAGFYEVVVWGQFSVLRLLKSKFISSDNRSDRDDYHYFVKKDGALFRLEDFRKKVYSSLLTNFPWLVDKVKNLRLHPEQQSDAIRIIKLVNQGAYHDALATSGLNKF